MANIEIQGLKELITDISKLKTELASVVTSMAEGVKAANAYNDSNLKAAKTLTELNKAAAIEAKTQETSNQNKLKADKITKDLILKDEQLAKAKIATAAQAQRYAAQIDKVSNAKKKATVDTNTWSKALGSFQAKFNIIGNILGGAFLSAIGGVIGAFKTVINWNNEFTAALNSLGAITGLRGKDLKDLGVTAREMGMRLNMSATEMLGAYEKVGSLLPILLKNKEALASVTEQAVLLTKASGGKLGLTESTAALGAVMNQFGLDSTQASRIVNGLAAAEVEGSATTLDLSESLKNVGAVASGANITFEQTSALLEVLASKQLVGAEAGTKLRGAILKLQDAGLGYQSGIFNINDALKEYKKSLESKTTAQKKDTDILKVFGIENVTAGKILLENIDNYESLTGKITGTSTALEQAALQTNNASEEWKKLGLQFQDAFTSGTFENINKNLAKGVQATISVLGGLAGYVWEVLRLIGEGLYKALDVGALIQGDYLENLNTLYKGFLERTAQDIDNVINPLKESVIASAEKTAEAVKIISTETTEAAKKQSDELTKKQKEENEKRLADQKKYREEVYKLGLTAIEREDLEFEQRLEKAGLQIDKILTYKQEEQQLLVNLIVDHQNKVAEIEQKNYDDNLALEEERTQEKIDLEQEAYDLKVNTINERYIAELAASQGNEALIDQAKTTREAAILAAEIAQQQAIIKITTEGSQKRLAAENTLNDLRVKAADDTSSKIKYIEAKELEVKAKTAEYKKQLLNTEIDAASASVEAIGTLAKKGSAIAKAAFVIQKALMIAKVWIATSASNAIITAETAAQAAAVFWNPFLAAGIIFAGASLITANYVMAGAQTALIAAQSVMELKGFAKGTKDAPGGHVIVGEKGSEIITKPDGTMLLTPSTHTIMDVPKHSVITPAHLVDNEMQKILSLGKVDNSKDNELMRELISTVKNSKQTSISIDKNGFRISAKQGLNTTRFLNDKYRC